MNCSSSKVSSGSGSLLRNQSSLYTATAEPFRLVAKQARQSTGRFLLGLNGTVVADPQSTHVTCVSILFLLSTDALHCLQRFGSLTNPFSIKNTCSADEKTNALPHRMHINSLSTSSIAGPIQSQEGRTRFRVCPRPRRKVNFPIVTNGLLAAASDQSLQRS